MNIIENKRFDEERALYGLKDTMVKHCVFDGPANGESVFKECENIIAADCYINLRYPFWHVNHGKICGCSMTENCRAALWYDENIIIEYSKLYGIKALRECRNIELTECDVISPEFLWKCENVRVSDSAIQSEYPFFECRNVSILRLDMRGKYSFQYVEGMTIADSTLDTKDAFWHSKNVTVTDSVLKGEYLGWYSENLKLVRCKIVGTQPLCYCKGLVLEDCVMEQTDLSFERSEVDAVIKGRIESVKNPLCGRIVADEIGELLIEEAYVDFSRTDIQCGSIESKILKAVDTVEVSD